MFYKLMSMILKIGSKKSDLTLDKMQNLCYNFIIYTIYI